MLDCDAQPRSPSARLLFVTSGLRIGGAERALLQLAAGLRRGGHPCAVISLSGDGPLSGELRSADIQVDCLDLAADWRRVTVLRRIAAVIRGFGPDLVQGWMYHGNVAGLAASKLAGRQVPAVWSVRQCVYDLATEKRGTRLVIRASAALSGAASAIVYPTEISALQHRALGFRGERATVIANGVDVERLRPHPERRDVVRERLGLRPRHVVLGHVARFDPIKNHRGLLRAVAEACTGRDDVRLVLVGPGVEWDNALLRNWLKENKLVDRTLLLGCRDDIADLMAAFDIFCLPSTSEGFPNALAEAGACGLTCVATEVGEAGAILGKDGLLVPAGDHDRLVTALREVMGWSDEQRHEAGERLRSHVVERFSTASMVAAFESLYSAVLAGHNGSGTRNSAAPG